MRKIKHRFTGHRHPATRVVFLTMHDEEAMFNKTMSLDVKGYVLKDSAALDISNCLNAVVAGQNFTSPASNCSGTQNAYFDKFFAY